jgi:hypothetical protein
MPQSMKAARLETSPSPFRNREKLAAQAYAKIRHTSAVYAIPSSARTKAERPMKRILAACGIAAFLWGVVTPASHAEAGNTLIPFESDEAFRAYLKKVKPPQPRRSKDYDGVVAVPAPPPPPPAPSAAAPASAESKSADDSVTNTQEAGVDEGGIVKTFGDYFVILRRGRLFTVSTARGGLRPVDAINAYAPGVTPRGDWYDEMLISGDRIIVIGYSYARGGTEVNRFRISRDGRLSFEDAYHLRSNDYYSSTNYASRLIGTRLIVYTPLFLPWEISDNFDWMPGVRRWDGDQDRKKFKPMLTGRQIYLPAGWDNPERGAINALHTIMDCDLASAEMNCKATGVLGPSSRNFYVSANAVYVWVTNNAPPRAGRAPGAMLYRMPLDGSAPQALGTMGAPTDQFSFSEDAIQERLNILVRREGAGDGMWGADTPAGAVALLQLPFSVFGDGSDDAPRRLYRPLPSPKGYGSLQNRFANGYVIYGHGAGWGRPEDGDNRIFAAAVDGDMETSFPLKHGVDRIDVMGSDAVVVGADGRDLFFQTLTLKPRGSGVDLGGQYRLRGASQGETRSHAFFFKPTPRRNDATAGLLGLPVARAGRATGQQLRENSASILFIRRAFGEFSPLGELEASESGVIDDGCMASCVDWYGNSRPLFWRNRIIALMGYELVEGEIRDGTRSATRIRETRRINFAPPKPMPAGR